MNGTYSLSIDTLNRADGTQMVALKHRRKADAARLDYLDYKYRNSGGISKPNSEEEKTSQDSRFFVLLERLSRHSPLVNKNTRELAEPYNRSIGTLSRSKKLLALPRFACGSL